MADGDDIDDDITERLTFESQAMRAACDDESIPITDDSLIILLEDALDEIETLRRTCAVLQREDPAATTRALLVLIAALSNQQLISSSIKAVMHGILEEG